MPALGLLDQYSKSETTGPAEWVRGSNPAALGLLLYEARGTVKTVTAASVELAERAEFQWNLCAQELGSATKDSDGKRPAALLKLTARDTTGGATEAVGARED